MLGNSGARAVICEDAAQVEKVQSVRGELDALEHVISIEPGSGDHSLAELRERGSDGDRAELGRRQKAVAREDPYTIIYTSGTTGPPKGVVLTHRNAMSVCEIVEELAFIAEGETTYLFLPLAHAFALTAMLASFDQGTAIVYYGGDSKQILAELIETQPTYLPSVPRIFEKLYTAAMKMRDQGSDEDRERFDAAVKLGVEVRLREHRGESVPEPMRAAFDAGRGAPLLPRARPVRRQHQPGGHRRGADRGRDPRVLLRLRRAGAGGLGHDRDDGGGHRGHARSLQVRHRRAGRCRASR